MFSNRCNLLKNDVLLNSRKDSSIRRAVGSSLSSILLKSETHSHMKKLIYEVQCINFEINLRI